MERVNLTFSIDKKELANELERLLTTAFAYSDAIEAKETMLYELTREENYEGALRAIAEVRDLLASADYRLHDIMNTMMSALQQNEHPQTQQSFDAATPPEPEPEHNGVHPKNLEARMQEARDNITKLGLEISEEQLQKLMRKANDATN